MNPKTNSPALRTPGQHLRYHGKYTTKPRIRKTPDERKRLIMMALSPVSFYGAELSPWTPRRAQGWVDGGLCLFHPDRRAGSFKINTNTGAFRCFSCGAAGTMIDFLMLRYGLDFMEALRELERRAGI